MKNAKTMQQQMFLTKAPDQFKRILGGSFKGIPTGTEDIWPLFFFWFVYIMSPFEVGKPLVTCGVVFSNTFVFGDGLEPHGQAAYNGKTLCIAQYHMFAL